MRVVLICGFILTAIAAPVKDEKQAKIISYANENGGRGNYKFRWAYNQGIHQKRTKYSKPHYKKNSGTITVAVQKKIVYLI